MVAGYVLFLMGVGFVGGVIGWTVMPMVAEKIELYLELEEEVTFEDENGDEKTLRRTREVTVEVDNKKCPTCDGEKHVSETCPTCDGDYESVEDCSNCEGTGSVEVECDACEGAGVVELGSIEGGDPSQDMMVECPECTGAKVVTSECETCDGSGEIATICGDCNEGVIEWECDECNADGYVIDQDAIDRVIAEYSVSDTVDIKVDGDDFEIV